jgi:hypothetical protein
MTREQPAGGDAPITVDTGEDWKDIREAVRRVCADFPQPY